MHTKPINMNWETAERLVWHLWVLAILLIFVLGVSLLGFMFPTAFWFGQELPMQSPQRAFFGFCVLLALVLVYLLQRQATVRRLKRQLFEAQAAVVAAEREADAQAFLDLPGTAEFRDALAMEYRRASTSGTGARNFSSSCRIPLWTFCNSEQKTCAQQLRPCMFPTKGSS